MSHEKKFKKTRELVRLALNDGWTQKDIADTCRCGSQSLVSDWYKGKRLAKVEVIKPLLDMYGHKLRRKSFRVYWDWAEDPGVDDSIKYFRVEGRVIMDHKFHNQRLNEKTGKIIRTYPLRRIIVHDQGLDQYLLLVQRRLKFRDRDELVESSSQDAGWVTEVVEPGQMDQVALIKFIDAEHISLLDTLPSDAITLPFLIRQALLYAGKSVDKVIDYPANS